MLVVSLKETPKKFSDEFHLMFDQKIFKIGQQSDSPESNLARPQKENLETASGYHLSEYIVSEGYLNLKKKPQSETDYSQLGILKTPRALSH